MNPISVMLNLTTSFCWLVHVDTEDLKAFSKSQGAEEADDLTHWDLTFWSERLRESKYEINEVQLNDLKPHYFYN